MVQLTARASLRIKGSWDEPAVVAHRSPDDHPAGVPGQTRWRRSRARRAGGNTAARRIAPDVLHEGHWRHADIARATFSVERPNHLSGTLDHQIQVARSFSRPPRSKDEVIGRRRPNWSSPAGPGQKSGVPANRRHPKSQSASSGRSGVEPEGRPIVEGSTLRGGCIRRELDRITAKEYRDGYRKPLRAGIFWHPIP